MTTPSGSDPDDSPWRRPSESSGDTVKPLVEPAAPGYPGPPETAPPPPGWRPAIHTQPPPPRQLPKQDPAALDQAEANARRVTQVIGIVAAALSTVLTCLLCSRLLF